MLFEKPCLASFGRAAAGKPRADKTIRAADYYYEDGKMTSSPRLYSQRVWIILIAGFNDFSAEKEGAVERMSFRSPIQKQCKKRDVKLSLDVK